MSTLTVVAASEPTEIDPHLRTAFDLFDCCGLRLQLNVLSAAPAGTIVDLRYSVDNGDTWTLVSAGGLGPKVPVSAAGSFLGAIVNVASLARGDVLLSPFIRGGNDSSTVVLGNVSAIAYIAVSALGACPEYPEGACALPAEFPIFGDDFSSYATYEDFIAARQYPSDPDYWNLFSDLFLPATASPIADFSTTIVLDGLEKALRVEYDAANYPDFSIGWITMFEALSSDITLQWVASFGAHLPNGFVLDIDGTTPVTAGSTERGFVVGAWEDKAPSGEGGARYFHYLLIRAGKLYHGIYQSGFVIQAEAEVGDAADFIANNITQLTFRADYVGSDARVRIYLDPACPDAPDAPTLWATCSGPRCSTNSQWRTVEVGTVYNCRLPSPALAVFTHQYSYSTDPTLYGLVP